MNTISVLLDCSSTRTKYQGREGRGGERGGQRVFAVFCLPGHFSVSGVSVIWISWCHMKPSISKFGLGILSIFYSFWTQKKSQKPVFKDCSVFSGKIYVDKR